QRVMASAATALRSSAGAGAAVRCSPRAAKISLSFWRSRISGAHLARATKQVRVLIPRRALALHRIRDTLSAMLVPRASYGRNMISFARHAKLSLFPDHEASRSNSVHRLGAFGDAVAGAEAHACRDRIVHG